MVVVAAAVVVVTAAVVVVAATVVVAAAVVVVADAVVVVAADAVVVVTAAVVVVAAAVVVVAALVVVVVLSLPPKMESSAFGKKRWPCRAAVVGAEVVVGATGFTLKMFPCLVAPTTILVQSGCPLSVLLVLACAYEHIMRSHDGISNCH